MSAKITAITLDCHEPLKQAEFWAAVLGFDVGKKSTSDFAYITHPEGLDPHMLFNLVPEGKTAKNRMHVDLAADNLETEVKRLVGLGATQHEPHDMGDIHWIVMTDPEDNEFCVVQEG